MASGSATFAGISATGDIVFYLKEGKIFSFDAVSKATDEVAESEGATMVNVSADGSHAYFFSTVDIAGSGKNGRGEEAEAGEDNLYAWDAAGSTVHFVTRLDPADVSGSESLAGWIGQNVSPDYLQTNGPGNNPSRTTPDGTSLVFQSRRNLTPYDSAGHVEIYRYDDTDRSLACVSCSPANLAAVSDARLEAPSTGGTTAVNALAIVHNISDDGSRVFFETADPLVPRDVDGSVDVYEWEAGSGVALISSGRSPADTPAGDSNYLYGITPSGDDVFLRTVDALVPAGGAGGTPAIYDARVGGGFAEESVQPCQDDACQGASSPPVLAGAASLDLRGPGNLKRHHRKKHKHQRKGRHRRHHQSRSGKRG